jgi:hypothetical protein
MRAFAGEVYLSPAKGAKTKKKERKVLHIGIDKNGY